MAERKMSRMKRRELVEIIDRLQEELETQVREKEELRKQLEDRRIRLEQAGSLAQACMELNQVLEAAQTAADQYVENINAAMQEKEAEARQAAEQAAREAAASAAEDKAAAEAARAAAETAKAKAEAAQAAAEAASWRISGWRWSA